MNKNNINTGWLFLKDTKVAPSTIAEASGYEPLDLPHTWNAIDGQDGGNDYFRGTSCYVKEITKAEFGVNPISYLEFEGVNSSCEVFVNGTSVVKHDGGYSTFRVDVTEYIEDNNVIAVLVDNTANEEIYPQQADFTFYGGIYRDVNILDINESRFDLDYHGGPGVMITPTVDGSNANVKIESFITNGDEDTTLTYEILNGETVIATAITDATETVVELEIENAHLWHGRKDPFLYTAVITMANGETVLDQRTIRFGVRSYEIDPVRGFILNGEEYPLRGVSRHQDFKGIGNALSHEHHLNDMKLIHEVGATTIRLAHYQHDQYFYDLCDEYGMVIWAEIPYITRHMDEGYDDTMSQMKELVTQNYNHPSIAVWGLSNEITANAPSDKSLLKNHNDLNDLCHEMDPIRPTTIAAVSMCDINDPYIQIPDTVSYNHYFGWYGGDVSEYGEWFDNFHQSFPNIPIGVSEYGCEAFDWHTSDPKPGDYTEEYQAYYHEELIKQLFTRKYLWATHVWNMFDFAADARSEGGENGMNHKGLVTFDRKYKKDSFYAYKAWLSDEKFVHICGKRYINRVEDETKVTVYSNLPEVEMFVNGESIGTVKAEDHFFYFNVKNVGTSDITAKAGEFTDYSTIVKVDEMDQSYVLQETGDIINWFEVDMPAGYYSINDTIRNIVEAEAGAQLITEMITQLVPEYAGSLGDGATMAKMMGNYTVQRVCGLIGPMMNVEISKEMLLDLNKKLNTIEKA